MLTLENEANPYEEKRLQIAPWKGMAAIYVPSAEEIRLRALDLVARFGLKSADAAHLACAIHAGAEYLITTDLGFTKAARSCQAIRVINPVDWILEAFP